MNRPSAILRFVRFPLVWTALADSTAGAAVAMAAADQWSFGQAAPLLLISPGLYLFGMGLNDLLDAGDDRLAGRDRPLPRGELSVGVAVGILVVLLGLVMAGTACVHAAALKMVALTLASIAIYNGLAKRWTLGAALFIAACRVGNVLIGWSLVTHSWRFDLHPRAAYGWGLVLSVASLAALASIISGLEKHHGLKSVLGMTPSSAILATLLLLPVADAVNVTIAWGGAMEGLLWLAAVPLILCTSVAVRRLRPRTAKAEPPRSDA